MEGYAVALLLQQVLDEALRRGASDVHLFTVQDRLVVQFRVGTTLEPYLQADDAGSSVIRRVKALAKMDVAETRLPQDGAFRWVTESLDAWVRAATLPTVHGEAMALRLLPSRREPLDFRLLGMTREQADTVNGLLTSRTGLVLVAGPTSSGKTTTLYAMMTQVARAGRRVISVEDPVEQVLDNCHQLEVRERIGITFDSGIKALLRHDPDVIMVGEIRDEPTAAAALRAAVTGHLVLSTTHAEDVIGAAARLADLGADRGLLAEVLQAVIVQSLHRVPSTDNVSCDGTGAHRAAQFDICLMTPEIRDWIGAGVPWSTIRHRLYAQPARAVRRAQ
ncbi:MAG: Flp pilus assembly complex ATPase component TadA [Alicyclobacillus sp.]|nr:Flp pilus assembly complex ATPase component TadA [Alicyclobacillus sp.]